jgi:hypothetical protein
MKAAMLVLLCAATLPAQPTPPAFKAETNLVLVPVVVRDAKGEAVGGLKTTFSFFATENRRRLRVSR